MNVGPAEVLVVALVALLVLGPDRLPDLARSAGETLRALKGASSAWQTEFRKAADMEATGTAEVPLPARGETSEPTEPQSGSSGPF